MSLLSQCLCGELKILAMLLKGDFVNIYAQERFYSGWMCFVTSQFRRNRLCSITVYKENKRSPFSKTIF